LKKKNEIEVGVPTLKEFLTDLNLYNIKQNALDLYKSRAVRPDAPDLFTVECMMDGLIRELASNGLRITLVREDKSGSTN